MYFQLLPVKLLDPSLRQGAKESGAACYNHLQVTGARNHNLEAVFFQGKIQIQSLGTFFQL